MNISEPFIRRPVMTTLVMLSILFFGYVSYKSLPVNELPNVDYPTIQVTVINPGSNPQTMAATCATPLEREFMTIDGLNTITSTSTLGQTQLILQFNLEKSMDTAALDVDAAINRASPNLPKTLPYNPTYNKVNPAATPILYFALFSPSISLGKLYDYANTNIGQRLSMIEGVSQVLTYGAPYAARIQVNPDILTGMNLDLEEVALAIQNSNVDLPTGNLYGDKNEYTLDVSGQVTDAQGYNNVVIKTSDGAIVKLTQVGQALDSLKNDKYTLIYKTKEKEVPCVVLAVQALPEGNAVDITNKINEILPSILKQLPSSLDAIPLFNKAQYIIEAVDDVKLTLLIAFILVVFIIFLYLGELVNTIIPAIAIPISILGTFSVMYLLGYSINILSLLAITLSIGFLVDDAIVVLENNVRHVQMGKKTFDATIEGSKEISITVLSMTMCLISVFIPLIFMGGIVGRLFKEFSITISTAVLISGFVSLSLTPLLCSRFIASYQKKAKKTIVEKISEKVNNSLLKIYEKALRFVLNFKKTTIFIGLLCVMGSVLLFIFLPKEFLPNEDMGFITGFTQTQDGTSPFEMAKYQKKVGDIISNNDNIQNVVCVSANPSDNQGLLFIRLKSFKDRKPIQKVINELMPQLYSIAGVNSYLTILPLLNLQTASHSKGLYQYYLTSIDQEMLNYYTSQLLSQIQKLPGFVQVSSDLLINQPQLQFEIIRDKASYLNISASKIENLLMKAFSDNKISTINTDINQYDVIIETLPQFYKDPTVIKKLFLANDETKKLIPLEEIVKLTETIGPLSVNHLNGLPSAAISFNLLNMPLGTAVTNLESLSKKVLPSSIQGAVLGTADVFKKSFQNLGFLVLLTFFVIYVILGILYEDFIHPITVMSTLAPACFGGLFMLLIFNETLSLYAFVGLVLLIGIVMKNGIMMVDFANDNLERGMPIQEAIYNAAIVRFRPIMMTSISALMGALPIALAIGGSSAQSKRSLGLVIVGGLIISQILTLLLTPVTYIFMTTIYEKIKIKRKTQGLG